MKFPGSEKYPFLLLYMVRTFFTDRKYFVKIGIAGVYAGNYFSLSKKGAPFQWNQDRPTGTCIDTSNVVQISIANTCSTRVSHSNFNSVSDTPLRLGMQEIISARTKKPQPFSASFPGIFIHRQEDSSDTFELCKNCMEDELIKNTNRIWQKLRSEDGILNKLGSITGEILVIGFAVSFSIWINSWSEKIKEQEEVLDFLLICQEEIAGDTADLLRCKAEIENALEVNSLISRITPAILDSIKANNLNVSFNGKPLIRQTHVAGYEGFKTSGRLGNIENKNLKRKIVEYYEVLMPSLSRAEELYNTNTGKTVDLIMDRASVKGKDAFLEKRIQMQLNLNLTMASSMAPTYANVLNWAANFQVELNKEITAKKESTWF
jgi:hypothetical protein